MRFLTWFGVFSAAFALQACDERGDASGGGGVGGAGGAAGGDPLLEGTLLEVPTGETTSYVDLDGPALVGESDGWELRFSGKNIQTNGGVSGPENGAAFGPLDLVTFAEDTVPAEVPFLFEDEFGGAFARWFAYDGNEHVLFSRFHVYGIRRGDELYKLQLLGFYGEAQGAPVNGLFRIRYARVTDAGVEETVEVMELDLASLASVRAFAAALADRGDRLDVLVNNAGVTMMKRTLTADGFEATFGVNHLGHFLLTNLLVDRLAAAGDGRVVVVASDAHRLARRGLDLDGRRAGRRYGAMRVYGESKLANILFTREAARRWADRGITVNCVHPGFVATRLGRDGDGGRLGELAMRLGRPFARTPEQGAETSVFLATSPTVAGVNGQYFANSRPASPSAAARDDDAARRLWEHSETLVGG